MTIAELPHAIADLPGDHLALIALGGNFVPILGVTPAVGSDIIVLRGRGKNPKPRFTVEEDGVLGRLHHLGLTAEQIGEVLGRPAAAVLRRKKALGYP